MDYEGIYSRIIDRSVLRDWKNRRRGIGSIDVPPGVYTEVHHKVPTCIGGSNDKSNLVVLTIKEHYICHLLLTKIHPKEKKLAQAWFAMRRHIKDELYSVRLQQFRVSQSGKLWMDKEYRKKVKSGVDSYWAKPGSRERVSKRVREENKDPEMRKKRTAHFKKPKSEEHKRKIGEKSKARMNLPEMKHKYRVLHATGKINSSRKVIDIETLMVYNSAVEAAIAIGKKYEVVKKWLYLKIPKHGLMWLDDYTGR